jgi:hypothetical protein
VQVEPESTASGSGRDHAGRRWTLPLMFVAGGVAIYVVQTIAWVAVSVLLDFPEGTNSTVPFIALWLVLVAFPLVAVWLRARGLRRWFAIGATTTMLVLLVELAVTAGRPVNDPEAAQRLEVTATRSPAVLYYPGPRFHGWRLDDEGIDHGGDEGLDTADTSFGPGDSLFLGYGTTCTTNTAGTCGVRYEIDLRTLRATDVADRCLHRLPTTRGVTPVELEGQGVVIFVDRLVVAFPDQPKDTLVTDIVRALRPVGDSSASTDDLPAPPASVVQLISRCPGHPHG